MNYGESIEKIIERISLNANDTGFDVHKFGKLKMLIRIFGIIGMIQTCCVWHMLLLLKDVLQQIPKIKKIWATSFHRNGMPQTPLLWIIQRTSSRKIEEKILFLGDKK